MPLILDEIDRIARKQQRGVLFLSFYDRALKEPLDATAEDDQPDSCLPWPDPRLDLD